MHPSPEFLFYIQELRSHPVAPGFPAKKELAPAVAAADEGEARKLKVSGFPSPRRLRLVAASLQDERRIRRSRKRNQVAVSQRSDGQALGSDQ